MFSARIGFFGTYTPRVQDLAVAHATTPYITAYPWTDDSGYGAKYTNPGTSMSATQNTVRFSPDNTMILSGQTNTPYTNAYKWTLSTGFGTKYSNPGTALTVQVNKVAWVDNTNILFGLNSSPYATAYQFTFASGYGTRYGAPSTAVPGATNDIISNQAGNCVAIAHSTTPYLSVYAYTPGTGFGTKFANPSPLGASTGRATTFGVNDTYITYGDGVNARTFVWDNTTGFGTLASTFSPGNNFTDSMALSSASSGTQTMISSAPNNLYLTNYPATTIISTVVVGSGITSVNGNGPLGSATVAGVAGSGSPYIRTYPVTRTSIGTIYPAPATAPAGSANDLAWTN